MFFISGGLHHLCDYDIIGEGNLFFTGLVLEGPWSYSHFLIFTHTSFFYLQQ